MSDAGIVIEGRYLTKKYRSGFFRPVEKEAVTGADIRISLHEIVTMVGESGSGKSTLGRMLLTQIRPDSGELYFRGSHIPGDNRADPSVRRRMQLISQNPESSFDPRWNIHRSLLEPLLIREKGIILLDHETLLLKLLHDVGMKPEHLSRYPHELSGGELQRLNIARNLSLDPDFLVCDEATSMLDVSTQAFILKYLMGITRERGLGLLFITHNIELARFIGDRVIVMYQGRIVEEGPDVLVHPLHPYTQALVASDDLNSDSPTIQSSDLSHVSCSSCGYAGFCPQFSDACTLPLTWKSLNSHTVLCNSTNISNISRG